MTTLTFQNKTLSVINQHNQIWLSTYDIANSLGYKETNGVTRLYNAHADEFTENMTALVEMQTNGGCQQVRIFSLRGAHLIGMLSHTQKAKDFRKWVLDILDEEIERQKEQAQPALPAPEPKYTVEFTEYELQQLAWLWFAFRRSIGTYQELYPLFNKLGSNLAPAIYGLGFEYLSVLRNSNQIIKRITQEFEIDPMSNWRVLHHLRNFDPKAKLTN